MNLQNTTKTKSFLTGLFSFILFLSAACFNSAVEVSGSAFPAGSCLAPLSIESSSPVIRVLTLFTAMDSKRKQDEVWRGKFPEHDYAPLYDGQRLTQSCMELLQAISAQKGDEEVFNILRDPRRRWEFFMAVDHIALFRTREEEMSRLDNMPNFSVEYLLLFLINQAAGRKEAGLLMDCQIRLARHYKKAVHAPAFDKRPAPQLKEAKAVLERAIGKDFPGFKKQVEHLLEDDTLLDDPDGSIRMLKISGHSGLETAKREYLFTRRTEAQFLVLDQLGRSANQDLMYLAYPTTRHAYILPIGTRHPYSVQDDRGQKKTNLTTCKKMESAAISIESVLCGPLYKRANESSKRRVYQGPFFIQNKDISIPMDVPIEIHLVDSINTKELICQEHYPGVGMEVRYDPHRKTILSVKVYVTEAFLDKPWIIQKKFMRKLLEVPVPGHMRKTGTRFQKKRQPSAPPAGESPEALPSIIIAAPGFSNPSSIYATSVLKESLKKNNINSTLASGIPVKLADTVRGKIHEGKPVLICFSINRNGLEDARGCINMINTLKREFPDASIRFLIGGASMGIDASFTKFFLENAEGGFFRGEAHGSMIADLVRLTASPPESPMEMPDGFHLRWLRKGRWRMMSREAFHHGERMIPGPIHGGETILQRGCPRKCNRICGFCEAPSFLCYNARECASLFPESSPNILINKLMRFFADKLSQSDRKPDADKYDLAIMALQGKKIKDSYGMSDILSLVSGYDKILPGKTDEFCDYLTDWAAALSETQDRFARDRELAEVLPHILNYLRTGRIKSEVEPIRLSKFAMEELVLNIRTFYIASFISEGRLAELFPASESLKCHIDPKGENSLTAAVEITNFIVFLEKYPELKGFVVWLFGQTSIDLLKRKLPLVLQSIDNGNINVSVGLDHFFSFALRRDLGKADLPLWDTLLTFQRIIDHVQQSGKRLAGVGKEVVRDKSRAVYLNIYTLLSSPFSNPMEFLQTFLLIHLLYGPDLTNGLLPQMAFRTHPYIICASMGSQMTNTAVLLNPENYRSGNSSFAAEYGDTTLYCLKDNLPLGITDPFLLSVFNRHLRGLRLNYHHLFLYDQAPQVLVPDSTVPPMFDEYYEWLAVNTRDPFIQTVAEVLRKMMVDHAYLSMDDLNRLTFEFRSFSRQHAMAA